MTRLLPLLLTIPLCLPLAAQGQTVQQELQLQRERNEQLRLQLELERQRQQNPPPPKQEVVVVENQQQNNGGLGVGVVLGTVLGAALSNSSLNCYGGRCNYGYNTGGYYPVPYPARYYGYGYVRRPSCSWGTGYQRCW